MGTLPLEGELGLSFRGEGTGLPLQEEISNHNTAEEEGETCGDRGLPGLSGVPCEEGQVHAVKRGDLS